MENKIILGLDNGNAYTKSSEGFSCQSGFTKSDVEPITKQNLLIYQGIYYSIGNNRSSVQLDKTQTQDAFMLSITYTVGSAANLILIPGTANHRIK